MSPSRPQPPHRSTRPDRGERPEHLRIERWTDEITDTLGHDVRSAYTERFWLGILGPSATWLLRTLSYGLDAAPDGFDLALADTARVLGLGDRTGRHSPMQRSIGRLCQFELAYRRADVLVTRRMVPWLEPRQLQHLGRTLRAEHAHWEQAESAASELDAMRRRAATMAMTTIRTGGTVSDAERMLARANVHPALARSTAVWAGRQWALATPPAVASADDLPAAG